MAVDRQRAWIVVRNRKFVRLTRATTSDAVTHATTSDAVTMLLQVEVAHTAYSVTVWWPDGTWTRPGTYDFEQHYGSTPAEAVAKHLARWEHARDSALASAEIAQNAIDAAQALVLPE